LESKAYLCYDSSVAKIIVFLATFFNLLTKTKNRGSEMSKRALALISIYSPFWLSKNKFI